MASSYTSIIVIPDATDITVASSGTHARIDIGSVRLIFATDGAHNGPAALDRLHEAITQAYGLLEGKAA